MPDPISYTDADLDVATRTLDGEARGEPRLGQQAVAWVIRNRVDLPSWWGKTVSEVCKHRFQFSCWNGGPDTDHIVNLDPQTLEFQELSQTAKSVFDGTVNDPTNGATMYKVTGTTASWDNAVAGIEPVIIGHHSFWRLMPNA